MRKKFNVQEESFSTFSAALVTGDTAILTEMGVESSWLGSISELLRRGVVVRTPEQVLLDLELRHDSDTVEALARLGAVMDRKVSIEALFNAEKSRLIKVKKVKQSIEAKVHRLIEEEGLGLVEACRKVHCRPSDYYIYRSKLKVRSYGR